MPWIRGCVYDLVKLDLDKSQIVMRGRDNGKTVFRAFMAYNDRIKGLNIEKKDTITGYYVIKSYFALKTQRYYTDIYIRDLKLIKKAKPKKKQVTYLIDNDTGEIIE